MEIYTVSGSFGAKSSSIIFNPRQRCGQELLDKYGLKRGDAILASEKHEPLYEELVKMEKVGETHEFDLNWMIFVYSCWPNLVDLHKTFGKSLSKRMMFRASKVGVITQFKCPCSISR